MSKNTLYIDETIQNILSEIKDKNTIEIKVTEKEKPVEFAGSALDSGEIENGKVYYISRFWNYHG